MTIKVKKGGVYTDSVGIFAKKAGVYSAVQGVFAKVAGVYTRVDQTPDQQVAALYAQIIDPAKPLVSFVEAFTQTSFNGVDSRAPTAAGIPTDSMGSIKLEYTVTGAAGATSLAINSGDQTKGTGTWGSTIQHDDGTYGLYCVTNLAGGTCTLYPALRATTTAGLMRNTIDLVGGQHLVEPGFKALARRVRYLTKRDGYRNRFASKWAPNTGLKADWTAYNGYNFNFAGMANVNSILGGSGMLENFIGRDAAGLSVGAGYVGHAGKGVTRSFPLSGASGMFEAFISRSRFAVALAGSFRVELLVDGVSVFNQVYSGFCRVTAPYPAGTTGVLRVTLEDELQFYDIRIGDVTWWAYDRAESWTDVVIGKDEKWVGGSTSWTTYYAVPAGTSNGQYLREVQALMQADGGVGTVTGVGQGGTTAAWFLANFDSLVPQLNGVGLILHAYINDGNLYGNSGYNRWLKDLYSIILKAQALGMRVVVNMPTQMGNQPQSTRHGIWSTKIGAGLPL